ncbi:MAG: hypothetical protein NC229_01590 [Bacteroides sp.]|nr:hypothetical protein [Bacteroidales bacterium]MCM1068691.1 hypothetical protein [Prevotella sp.]MCM1353355.1 hypothetical protein [Bacteroides sp.]MCM1402788.1 hypothetical protein [Bacteroides sp.]MCM1442237.1 hypothetical protein [Muribaculum sp.]
MEEFVRQRVKDLIFTTKKISLTSIGESSATKMQLSRQINGNTSISLGTILLILSTFPDISAEWLLRGDGDMYKDVKSSDMNKKDTSEELFLKDEIIRKDNIMIEELRKRVEEQEKYIVNLNEYIELIKKKNTPVQISNVVAG